MLPIRANANVTVNENNPSSARELLAYYNLEQYPKTHLFYGPQFTDQYAGLDKNNPYVDDKPKYEKDEALGKYVIVNDYKNGLQNYNSRHASLLPRMWSSEHAENYMMYAGFLDFSIKKDLKGIFNLGSGKSFSLHKIIKMISNKLNIPQIIWGKQLKLLIKKYNHLRLILRFCFLI